VAAVIRFEGNGYVISSRHCWLPGVYENERTARWAFRFSDIDLQRLQDEANKRAKRVITRADMAALSARKKETPDDDD
jgi:hypothetical protein